MPRVLSANTNERTRRIVPAWSNIAPVRASTIGSDTTSSAAIATRSGEGLSLSHGPGGYGSRSHRCAGARGVERRLCGVGEGAGKSGFKCSAIQPVAAHAGAVSRIVVASALRTLRPGTRGWRDCTAHFASHIKPNQAGYEAGKAGGAEAC